jgi:Leucine-rich repeat (LRR) protein
MAKKANMSRRNSLNQLRHLVLAVLLVSSLALLVPYSVVKADSVVTFPDANLEAAIREAMVKPGGGIYQSDLIGLTALSADNRGIRDLTGLEHCTALTTLYLHGNQIRSLAPLSGLTNLTTLGLNSNQVSDLAPLSGLTNLKRLGLDSNRIRNLAPLSGVADLAYLRLNYNLIDDISAVAGLTKLTSLFLMGNQIDNLTPITGLTPLTGLWLNGNQIVDLTPLSGLTGLTQLGLGSNRIVDLAPLSGLTSVTELVLNDNQISNLSPLSGLSSLKVSVLNDNQISNLSPLSGLNSLSWLSLESNLICDIQSLVDNPGMGSGDVVALGNNQLNANAVNTCIPALLGRGVAATWDLPVSRNPDQPTNVSPHSGAARVSPPPRLKSSAFSDPDAVDTHVASQWQVTTTPGDYSSPVFDSNTDNVNLTSMRVPSLRHSTTYYWRAAHQDNHGDWSNWSEETSFTTGPRIPTWLWVVIGIGAVSAVVALGVVAFLVRRRLSRR